MRQCLLSKIERTQVFHKNRSSSKQSLVDAAFIFRLLNLTSFWFVSASFETLFKTIMTLTKHCFDFKFMSEKKISLKFAFFPWVLFFELLNKIWVNAFPSKFDINEWNFLVQITNWNIYFFSCRERWVGFVTAASGFEAAQSSRSFFCQ